MEPAVAAAKLFPADYRKIGELPTVLVRTF